MSVSLGHCHRPRPRGDGYQYEWHRGGQRHRESSAGRGRCQCPRSHPALGQTRPRSLRPAPGTQDSLPASPGVGIGYLHRCGRRAVKTPPQQPRSLAGREKRFQKGHRAYGGRSRGRYLPAARVPAPDQPPPPSCPCPLLAAE